MGSGDSERIGDAWWGKRAKCLLHPIQVEIIETFRLTGRPLSVRNLADSDTLGDTKLVHLRHHLGRLKKLGALEPISGQSGVEPLDVLYRLTPEQSTMADKNPVAVQFGKNLRAYRIQSPLSQKELLYRTSLTGNKLNSFEQGESEPSIGEVIRLASAFSISINDLLGGIEWKLGARGGKFYFPDLADPLDE